MTVLLVASAGVLTAAAILSLIVAIRSGDMRVLLLTGVFLLLAVPQGVALLQHGGQPLALDPATAAAAAGLAAGLLGLAAVVGIARVLRELDHAEVLHWESMESVRSVSEFAQHRGKSLEDRLPELLENTCARFGLEIGLVSRVRDERYEVLAIHAPPEFPVGVGMVCALDETSCRATLESERPIAASNRGDSRGTEHAGDGALCFETYLASAIQVGNENFGTLVFASTRPARQRLTATHKDIVRLMAQWLGWEFEQLQQPRGASPHARSRVQSHANPGLRVDSLLRRIARRVRKAVPEEIEIEMHPGSAELPTTRNTRLPLEAILMSLVQRAAGAMPDGGTLRIEASTQEPPVVSPDVIPAIAPSRYVTLTVSESSGGLDPDAIAGAFETSSTTEVDFIVDSTDSIPLSAIYRMLKRAGGDLSVEVESGRGSRFTLFLPLADSADTRPRAVPHGPRPAPPLTQTR